MMMIFRGTDIKRANKITMDRFPCLNECCVGCLFGDSFGVVCMMTESRGITENEKFSQMTMMHATARHGKFGYSEVVNVVK